MLETEALADMSGLLDAAALQSVSQLIAQQQSSLANFLKLWFPLKIGSCFILLFLKIFTQLHLQDKAKQVLICYWNVCSSHD